MNIPQVTIFTGLVKINQNLVGTAVAYKELAQFLSKAGFLVNLVLPEQTDLSLPDIQIYIYKQRNNQRLIDQSKVVIFGAYPPVEPLKYAYQKNKRIITYLWSLAPLGSLEFNDFFSHTKQQNLYNFIVESYNLSLIYADKIFVRNIKARDFVLGSLISLGRVNLKNYFPHRNFKSLIEISGFGLPSHKPKKKNSLYRNKLSNIEQKDFLIIWNGGIWNWHDAQRLVKIMQAIYRRRKDIKLIFQGFHNPHNIYTPQAKATKKLADKLKLTDRNIFFSGHWITFKNRADFLLEANAGIVTSPNIPEANFFTKTRFYDYLWADLPIILDKHEAFAPEVGKYNLGVILEGNIEHDAENIINFIQNQKIQQQIQQNIRDYKKNLTWRETLKPVIQYCRALINNQQ